MATRDRLVKTRPTRCCRRERPCDAPGYTLPVGKLRERDESCRDDSTELGEVLSLKILPSGAKLI